MKILIPEQISEIGIELLKNEKGFEVDFEPGLDYKAVLERIEHYDGLITRSGTPVTEELITKGKNLKLIGRAGVGIDNIDIDAASKRGILIVNVPAGNIMAATEHTIAMMLASTRQIPRADQSVRKNQWDRKAFMGTELYKKTVGIIGLGKIGSRVAKRLKAFEMNIIAYDPYVKPERAELFHSEYVDLDTLLEKADFITVHTPLTNETKGMIAEKEFAKMKDGVRLVNCARGGIYDEQALYNALKSGKVKSAAVDVFTEEPLYTDHPLKELDNIVLTPHLGANTAEAQVNVSIEICEHFITYSKQKFLANAINAPFSDIELAKKLGPLMNLTEKMAMILENNIAEPVKVISVNVEGLENDAVKPIVVSAVKGFLTKALGETVNYVNALFEAEDRGIDIEWKYSPNCKDFHSMVKLEISTEKNKYTIAGTCFAEIYPRIVSINEYMLEIEPKGHLIIIKNKDIPGVIGHVGTLFGSEEMNIAEYRLGRSEKSKEALAAIIVDQKPNKRQIDKLKSIKGIIESHYIFFKD
jgi:D-3-phosphoglycerate dehydrogenase / 2-oxoglutarate reductase